MWMRLRHELRSIELPVGIVLGVGLWIIGSPFARAAGLFLAVVLVVPTLYRLVGRGVPFLIVGIEERLSQSVGLVAGGAYYCAVSPGGWRSYSALALSVLAGFGLWILLLSIRVYKSSLGALVAACETDEYPRTRVPFVLVHGMPGFAEYYAVRLTSQMRVWFTFAAILEKPIAFMSARHLANHSPEVIARIRESAIAHVFVGSVRDVVERPGSAVAPEVLAALHESAHVTVAVWIREGRLDLERNYLPADELIDVRPKVDGLTTNLFVSTVHRRVVRTSLPLIDPDRALSLQSRRILPFIASEGWAPVSDAYLRVRLGQSDIERFVALLDVRRRDSSATQGRDSVPGQGLEAEWCQAWGVRACP